MLLLVSTFQTPKDQIRMQEISSLYRIIYWIQSESTNIRTVEKKKMAKGEEIMSVWFLSYADCNRSSQNRGNKSFTYDPKQDPW